MVGRMRRRRASEGGGAEEERGEVCILRQYMWLRSTCNVVKKKLLSKEQTLPAGTLHGLWVTWCMGCSCPSWGSVQVVFLM